MTVYIALLRGVNVGGHRIIKMAQFKEMLQGMGYDRVQTYIQSGNAVFESGREAVQIREDVERKILSVFGFPVTVVMRTTEELGRLIRDCPFQAELLAEGEQLYVSLLNVVPKSEGINRLAASPNDIDEYRIIGRDVYLLYRQPVHKSKLTNNFLEKKLGLEATSRNWQTMNKLLDMARAMEADLGSK